MTELQKIAEELGMSPDATPDQLRNRVADLSGDGFFDVEDQQELYERIDATEG